ITRATVIDLCKELGYSVEERSVARTELYRADECFLVGTGCQVSFVKSIDRREIANGERGTVSNAIQEAYENGVYGRDATKASWLTPV
ncbi:MAG: aminotransferase class IV, partial [Planctomycetes bacterium]|nr:aminotransferase class IV [Planctomycetota bacterium]